MSMSDDLKAIEAQVQEGLAKAETMDALEALRVATLGRKGSLTAIMHTMGKVPPEERPAMGALANTVRANVDMAIKERKEKIARDVMARRMEADAADVTLPGRTLSLGTQHLISQIREEIEDIFCGLGYTVEDGPYVETTYYNFTALNAPEDHPSRSAKDTFYVVDNQPEGKEVHVQGESDVLLRTQTSGVQAHVMETKKPPIYMICPGTVFRPDTADANHLPQFTPSATSRVPLTISRARFSARTAPRVTARTSSRSPSLPARSTSPAASATARVAASARTPAGSRSWAAAWSTPTSSATAASTPRSTPASPSASASSASPPSATTCLTCACS